LIKRLAIENFKSIRSLELECRRVNVFIGEPNTGKSNILEALGLLSFIAYKGRITYYVRMRQPHELFHNFDVKKPFSIEPKPTETEIKVFGEYEEETGALSLYVEDDIGIVCVAEIMRPRPSFLEREREKLRIMWKKEKLQEPTVNFLRRVKFYRFARDIRLEEFEWKESPRPSLLPPYGENLPTVMLLNPKLRDVISELLGGYGYKLLIDRKGRSISIAQETRGVLLQWPYILISDTLQRLIFHLAAIESNEGAAIIMEEPEAHAFPTYTKYLAERVALDERNQYFISTHNPYFLLSLVEKTPIKELAVYLTYLRGYETRAKLLSEEELEELLDMTSDVFFNLDVFVPGEET